MEAFAAQLPPGARMLSADDPNLRVFALIHMIDRVCIGRCFSYANYETSSAAFRVRVAAECSRLADSAATGRVCDDNVRLVGR